MKKVLSLVLVMAMVLSSMSFAFAAEPKFSDMADNDYEDAVNALNALGVISGYEDGSYQPTKTVKRAEMAKLMVELLGYGDLVTEGAKSNFVDTQGHWADAYIALAAGRGIVVGTGDGRFNPEGTVTYDQVYTMLVRGLGYTDNCNELKGMTWPTNFKVKASELEITKDVKMPAAAADRGGVAQAMYNALDCALVTVDTDGNVTTIKDASVSSTTAISKKLLSRIAERRVITVQEEYLNPNSDVYAGDIVDLAPYMYQNLVVYVDKYDDDKILYIDESKSLVVEGAIDDATDETINVETANGKIVKVPYANTSGGAYSVFYNGVEIDGLQNIKKDEVADYDHIIIVAAEEQTNSKGDLVAVDKINGKIEAGEITGIVVQDQTDAKRISKEYVDGKDKLDGINLPVDDSDKVDPDAITVEGAVTDIKDIKVDDAVVAYASDDLDVIRLVVSRDTVEGKITRVDSSSVYVDGTKYSKNHVSNPSIDLGDEGTFYLDHNGDIVEFDGSASGPSDYAVIVGGADGVIIKDKFDATVKSIDEYAELKLSTQEDEVIEYEIAAKIKDNGDLDADKTATLDGDPAVTVNTSKTALEIDSSLKKGTLVKYNLDKNGRLKDIEIADTTTLSTNKDLEDLKLADGVIVFDGRSGEDYAIVNSDRLDKTLAKDVTKVVYNKDGWIEVIVTESVKDASEVVYAFVSKVNSAYDTDGEKVQYVEAYMNGEKQTRYTSGKATVGEKNKVYAMDLDGEVIDKAPVKSGTITTASAVFTKTGRITLASDGKTYDLADNATVISIKSDDAFDELCDLGDIDVKKTEFEYFLNDDNEIAYIVIQP